MNDYERAVQWIEKYPENFIPLREVCEKLLIKRSALVARISRYELPAKLVGKGYKYVISKKVVFALAEENKSAILKWITKVELAKRLGVNDKAVGYLVRDNNLEREYDLTGKMRLHPETQAFIAQEMISYTADDMLMVKGETYRSLTSLATTMAKNVVPTSPKKKFNKVVNRYYKALYHWMSEGFIPHIRTRGKTNYFVPQETFDLLKDKLPVGALAKVTGLSRRSLYNWIDNGMLEGGENPSGKCMMPSIKDVFDAHVLALQKRLSMRYRGNAAMIVEIADLDSQFWQKELRKIRTASAQFRKERLKGMSREEYISSLTGMAISDIFACKTIARKRRFKNTMSLNKPLSEDSDTTLLDMVEGTPRECQNFLSQEFGMALAEHLDEMDAEDRDLIEMVFGLEGPKKSFSEIAALRGVEEVEVEEHVEEILEDLREKISG